MLRKHNKQIVPLAKKLRKNMTKEEKHLWYDFLQGHKFKFSRQKVLGKYIADFYCSKVKLVIELDGSEHYLEDNIIYDNERTLFLQQYGLKVIRISNYDLNTNFEGVCQYIDLILEQLSQTIPQSQSDSSLYTRQP